MFVNFAKEQSDGDHLTEVVVSNRTVQTNRTALTTRINPPIIPPQQPMTPPQISKTTQEHGKSSDSKEGKSKKAKASKGKSKDGKGNGEKSSSTAMTRIAQPEKMDQMDQRATCGSNSANAEGQGESSNSRGSKNMAEVSSKDPSALFIVSSNTQDSIV